MKYILLLTCDPQTLDMTPGSLGVIGDYTIHLEPKLGTLYEWVFCYEKVITPTSIIVREGNTVFIPGEPESIKGFSTPFINQFNYLFSFRADLRRQFKGNIIEGGYCLTPWRLDLDTQKEREGVMRNIRTRDQIKTSTLQKTNFMSYIFSGKTGTPLHRARLKLAQAINNTLGDAVHLYSDLPQVPRKTSPTKSVALDSYLYSICVENTLSEGYFTEKVVDSILTGTIPLYAGCPNIKEFLPNYDDFFSIDIWDINSIIEKIKDIMVDPVGIYNRYLNNLAGMRDDILDRLNICYRMVRIADSYRDTNKGYHNITLIPDTVDYFY